MTSEPLWIERDDLLAIHDELIAETGGAPGVRDLSLLESALARPVNRYHYENERDLVRLAATYAVAVAKNHPLVDGNKRAAFMCLALFLELNQLLLIAGEDDATRAMVAVAAGEWSEDDLTGWVGENHRPLA